MLLHTTQQDHAPFFSLFCLPQPSNHCTVAQVIPYLSSDPAAVEARKDPTAQQAFICNLEVRRGSRNLRRWHMLHVNLAPPRALQ